MNKNLTNQKLKNVAKKLGFEISGWDCFEIRRTSKSASESAFDAVTDYLNAFETCLDFEPRRREFESKGGKK